MPAEKTVDGYIAGLGDWRGDVIATLRGILRDGAPEARETIKWAQPVYEDHGPFCYIKAFPKQVNFGFWRGADLTDPQMQVGGERMGHIKLFSPNDVRPDEFRALVAEAVTLNRTMGDPTKRKAG